MHWIEFKSNIQNFKILLCLSNKNSLFDQYWKRMWRQIFDPDFYIFLLF